MKKFRKIVEWWKNSALFKLIDKLISKRLCGKVRNDDFTILCSNCIGGTVYHRMGKKFLTPTINMWFKQPDFVKFLLHLDEYLKEELRFIDGDEPFPVAQLGGVKTGNLPLITLYFNHDKFAEEANKKWLERKARIRKENLYIMLYNLDGLTKEEIHSLDEYPCNNKVIFTSKPLPDVDWSLYIEPVMSDRYPYNYLEKNVFGKRRFEKYFDYAGFFNKRRAQTE